MRNWCLSDRSKGGQLELTEGRSSHQRRIKFHKWMQGWWWADLELYAGGRSKICFFVPLSNDMMKSIRVEKTHIDWIFRLCWHIVWWVNRPNVSECCSNPKYQRQYDERNCLRRRPVVLRRLCFIGQVRNFECRNVFKAVWVKNNSFSAVFWQKGLSFIFKHTL